MGNHQVRQVLTHEIDNLLNMLQREKEFHVEHNDGTFGPPKLTFIIVSKRIGTKYVDCRSKHIVVNIKSIFCMRYKFILPNIQ